MSNTPSPIETPVVRLVETIPTDDDTIRFHVSDGALGTIHSCVAVWDGVQEQYEGNDAPAFDIRTGSPEADVFSTSADCVFTEHSRLAAYPSPAAFDDGTATGMNYDPGDFTETGEIYLAADLDAGSRLEVLYYFHVVDSYARRAKVFGDSDAAGEWVAISEVVSEDDSSPSATSNLFLGKASVSGDDVNVSYLDEDGDEKANSDDAPSPSPTPLVTPTPTNVPGRYGRDPYPDPTPTRTPSPPDRGISINFGDTPAKSGDTAIVFIRDNYLGTKIPCTVEWTNIKTAAPANTVWNVVNGSPRPKSFVGSNCGYNGTTPIAKYPRVRAFVDGVEYGISHEDEHGRVSTLNKVDAGSALRIEFHYEIVDDFDSDTHLAKIYSTSDKGGEWVALREVVSESDASPSASSSLFRGEVAIIDNEASLAAGDGQVRVRRRSRLGAAYYDDGGQQRETVSVGLDLPTPTPTPIPSPSPIPTAIPAIPVANPWLIIVAVVVGALAVLLGRRRGVPPMA